VPTPLLTAAGQRRELYVQPGVVQYGRGQADELAELLKQMDMVTTVHPLCDFDELQLGPDGRTLRGGYRFTSYAFFQTAQFIAPGLSKLMPEISGSIQLPDDREELVDGVLSTDLWNKLVDLRFPLFRQTRIIRNEDERTIEGLLGSKAQYLGNHDLYTQAVEAMETHQPNVSMYAAQLVGRRMSVWFRAATTMFSALVDGKQWPVYHGYYFTNGEATGTSVRGSLAVYTPKGMCLGPYKPYGGRVTHTGKDFYQKLGQMFAKVCSADIPDAQLLEGLYTMVRQELGYSIEMNRAQRKDQTQLLIHSLSLLGVPKNLAADVVESGLAIGRDLGKENYRPMEQVNRLYSSRTLLDLFIPLLNMSRRVDLSRREKMEQAAFAMMTGRFLI